jgi:beta-N-acetylhexosaminidase
MSRGPARRATGPGSLRLSRDVKARRRLAAVAVLAFVALVAGIAVGAGNGGDDGADRPSRPAGAKLPLEEQLGQLLISSFDGPELPDYMGRRLEAGQTAGVILFGGNVRNGGQLQRLTAALQRAAGGSAIVSTDQEGGPIRTIQFAGPAKPQPGMGSSEEAGKLFRGAGRELRELGVNADRSRPTSRRRSRACGGLEWAPPPSTSRDWARR